MEGIQAIDQRLREAAETKRRDLVAEIAGLEARRRLAELVGDRGIVQVLQAGKDAAEGELAELNKLLGTLSAILAEPAAPADLAPAEPVDEPAVRTPTQTEHGANEEPPMDHGAPVLACAAEPALVVAASPGSAASKLAPARASTSAALKEAKKLFLAGVLELDSSEETGLAWSLRVRATACRGQAIMEQIDRGDDYYAHFDEEFKRVVRFAAEWPGSPESLAFGRGRRLAPDVWLELAGAFEMLAAAVPALDWLESAAHLCDDAEWLAVYHKVAAADAYLFRAIDSNAPGWWEAPQHSVHDRLVALQDGPLDGMFVAAWDPRNTVAVLRVDGSGLPALLAKAQRPRAKAQAKTPTGRQIKTFGPDAVLALHWALVKFFGDAGDPIDPAGPRDVGLVESAVARPWTSLGGAEKYKSLSQKAAALVHSLILNHPFHNGNKRTALASLVLFLRQNNHLLIADEDELFRFLVAVASHSLPCDGRDSDDEVREMSAFIRAHMSAIGAPSDMKLDDFLSKCRQMGCSVRERPDKLSYAVRNGAKSINIKRSVRELGGPVVKAHLSTLGLGETHSGILFENFASDDLSPSGIVARYQQLLRRLAAYG